MEKSKILLFCGHLEMDVKKKKKKRWDVDHCESFLGKKGRTNTGCCLTAVKAKDLVLTQAVDIDGCRTQRRSWLKRKTFPL